jgi:hypothetical protein
MLRFPFSPSRSTIFFDLRFFLVYMPSVTQTAISMVRASNLQVQLPVYVLFLSMFLFSDGDLDMPNSQRGVGFMLFLYV